jgi:hypothetical protein
MEELHSTANLEKEILDEAEKKAARIRKSTDSQIEAARRSAESHINAEAQKEEKRLADRLAEERDETATAGKLGKKRAALEKANTLMAEALEKFLGTLSREQMLGVLQSELDKRLRVLADDCAGKQAETTVTYRDLSESEVSALIGKSALAEMAVDKKQAGPNFIIPGTLPALIIDNGDILIKASVNQAAEDIMLDKREEIYQALLGDDAKKLEAAA